MELKDLFDDPPKIHPFRGQLLTWGLPKPTLDFIDTHVTQGSQTLETGAGLSTILFAIKGASHICITPFQEEVDRIRDYCQQRGISLEKVDFRVDLSTTVLPALGPVELDFVLIDGCHGFPTPFIDWYYTVTKLKIGGTLIVDDVQLWTGRVLQDFLAAEPEWKLVEPFSDKTSIFLKLHHYHPWKEFEQQLYVVKQDALLQPVEADESKLTKGLRLLRQGHILTLVRKLANQMKGEELVEPAPKTEPRVNMPPGTEDPAKIDDAVPRLARRAAEQQVRAAAASAGASGTPGTPPRRV